MPQLSGGGEKPVPQNILSCLLLPQIITSKLDSIGINVQ